MRITSLGSSRYLNTSSWPFGNIENVIMFAGEFPYEGYLGFNKNIDYSSGDVIYNNEENTFYYAKYYIKKGKDFNKNDWGRFQLFKDDYLLNQEVNNLNVAQLLNL